MTTVLVLVDLQQDFLDAPGLEPTPGELVRRVALLLAAWRETGRPVVHVRTTVTRSDDRRMPHWRAAGRWQCEAGTPGHATPEPLRSAPGEPVVDKTDFSAFAGTRLDDVLDHLGAHAVVLAGTHLHACVRATALDAYARRLDVSVAVDAVGTDDPLHADLTSRWLGRRGVRLAPVDELVGHGEPPGDTECLPAAVDGDGEHRGSPQTRIAHVAPARPGVIAWTSGIAGKAEIDRAVAHARTAAPAWAATKADERAAIIARLADLVDRDARLLASAICADVGKPVTDAREEVGRTAELLRAVAVRGGRAPETDLGAGVTGRDLPLGVVALVTPWNNPLAIPAGKLAPALVHGNVVAWKPAPAGTRIAVSLVRLAREAGLPPEVLALLAGDEDTARRLMDLPEVDAITLTGGTAAGRAAQLACARRPRPLQAELGGNNAALVSASADVPAAAAGIVAGAFGFAGQRCTANRRAVVLTGALDAFLTATRKACEDVVFGDPADPATTVGPVIDARAAARIEATIDRALRAGARLVWRHTTPSASRGGPFVAPAVLLCEDASAEIVQEETFGPVLVVQPARDWTHAIALADGVRHGLVAAAFTTSEAERSAFLAGVRAGVLKLGQSTAGAAVDAPFGGWKASGIGPPEHGASNHAFYTRPQAVYSSAG